MSLRFEKVLAQIATSGRKPRSHLSIAEVHEHRVKRIEELMRAEDALGDRIVISLGIALLVSAVALPVYAFHFSNGYAYLPNVVGWNSSTPAASEKKILAAEYSPLPSPTVTGSLKSEASPPQKTETSQGSIHQGQSRQAAFERYIIHRATENSALIEGPDGIWWVTPGMTLPGAGRIIFIGRSDNGWSVVTSDTTITQSPSQGASS